MTIDEGKKEFDLEDRIINFWASLMTDGIYRVANRL